VLESGDLDAAREQARAALTTVARWLLISKEVFPLSRNELSDQLSTLKHLDLAEALYRLIHDQPCSEELRTDLDLGELLVTDTATISPYATSSVAQGP
jgi:hypothetical protein